MAGRSPLRVECKVMPVVQKKACRWTCDGDVTLAVFQHRKDPGREQVIHPSTRKPGTYQLTWFRDGIPAGHSEGRSCAALLKDDYMAAKDWKLTKLVRK